MSVKVECPDDRYEGISLIKVEAGHDDLLSHASISSTNSSSSPLSDPSSSTLGVQFSSASSVASTSNTRKRAKWLAETSCFVCAKWFCGKSARDQHLVTHFGTLSDVIMSGSDRWLVANSAMNECPLCGCVTSKRKGLRHHLILRHVLREPGALESLVRWRSPTDSANHMLCVVDQRECDLVQMLLGSPKLLWKRKDVGEEKKPRRKNHHRKNANKVFIQ